MKRWLTGIVAAPLLFAIILFGSRDVFLLLVILLTLAGAAEYGTMVHASKRSWENITGLIAAVILPVSAHFGGLPLLLSVMTLCFIAVFLVFLGRLKGTDFDLSPLNKTAFGLLYIPLLTAHLILLRDHANGVVWIFFMIVIAFTGDITAFYVGRTFGKTKLMPHVSAGKTVAGTVGSVAGSVAGCMLFKAFFLPAVPMVHAIAMGFAGNIIGELGDLCESVIKRGAGVKDSGFIFPGHGGVLDRLDCILFIAPFLYYYRLYVLG